MSAFLYFTTVAFLITHELDAVKRHEWRVLPLTSFLPDVIAARVFIWAHVPLFLGLFYFGGADPFSPVAKALSAFAILHVGLHWGFRRHPKNEFNTAGAWALIIGAGVFGAAHLLALL